MNFSLTRLSLFFYVKVKCYYFLFSLLSLYSHMLYLSTQYFTRQKKLAITKKKTQRISPFFFLGNIFDMSVETVFQHQSLGNLDTSTFLSREMIIYSYTLLPVIKPFPYLRQNIFHNNKETHFLKFLDHLQDAHL